MRKTSLKKLQRKIKRHGKVGLFHQSLKNGKRLTKNMRKLKESGKKKEKPSTSFAVSMKMGALDVPKGQIVRLTIRDSEGNISATSQHSGPCAVSITTGCILSTQNEPRNSDCCLENTSGRHDWGGEDFDKQVDKNMGWSIFGRKDE